MGFWLSFASFFFFFFTFLSDSPLSPLLQCGEGERDSPGCFVCVDREGRSNVTVLTNRSRFGDLSLSVTLCFSCSIGSHAWDCLNFPPAQRSYFPQTLGAELIVGSKKRHFQAPDEEPIYRWRARHAAKLLRGRSPASEMWVSSWAPWGYLRTHWCAPRCEASTSTLRVPIEARPVNTCAVGCIFCSAPIRVCKHWRKRPESVSNPAQLQNIL